MHRAGPPARQPRRLPRWTGAVTGAVVVCLLVGGALAVRHLAGDQGHGNPAADKLHRGATGPVTTSPGGPPSPRPVSSQSRRPTPRPSSSAPKPAATHTTPTRQRPTGTSSTSPRRAFTSPAPAAGWRAA